MNSKELVSIIVPVYNVEKYLEKCMLSLLNQTYKNIEILAVDDGSTDGSLDILKEFQLKDPRLIVFSQKNGGQASARNLGLEKASGDYIMFVDSDDYVKSNFVSSPLNLMQISESQLVIFDVMFIGGKHNEYRSSGTGITSASSMPVNKLYKKECWDDIRFPTGYWFEDLGTIPIVVSNAKKIAKLNEANYLYVRNREDSQSNTIQVDKILDTIPMCERVYKTITAEHTDELMLKELELLFIDHLINNTILLKFLEVSDSYNRVEMITNIKKTMDIYFPGWSILDYENGNFFSKNVKRIAAYFYLNGYFFLGDVCWKFPKKIIMKEGE